MTCCAWWCLACPHAAVGQQAPSLQPGLSLQGVPDRIAFGSCADQNKPQPILRMILERDPDLFIYLGDNIYGDTEDMEVLRSKYALLGAKEEFQELRARVPVLAIWDDHDYGANDAGKEYPFKEASKQIFLDFWGEPEDSERRKHPGIYHSHLFTDGKRALQVILLDTRSFRDPLASNRGIPSWKNDYHPDPNPSKTLLGEAQWRWLEAELRKPADLRIVASSIQFGHEYNGWESWTNLPGELMRMLDLIKSCRAEGVIFISGDVHWGELSILEVDGLYPLHDLTSSGLTEDWDSVEPNRNRHGQVVRENNAGFLEIDWSEADPALSLQVLDVQGEARIRKDLRRSELRFKN